MTDNFTPNLDQINYWSGETGRTWVDLYEELDAQSAPHGRRALDGLNLQPGDRVLDIGCGSGQSTLEIARRVAPDGLALGVDVSGPMLELAGRRAIGQTSGEAAFLNADAQAYEFERERWDAVYSRFGVMFFADPVAAFSNLRAALRPGGKLSFVCWRSLPENEWVALPVLTALQHVPSPQNVNFDAPGPFALSSPERVIAVLSEANFQDITIEPQDLRNNYGDIDAALRIGLRVGALSHLVKAHPEKAEQVIQAVRAALTTKLEAGQVVLGSASWLVTARAP